MFEAGCILQQKLAICSGNFANAVGIREFWRACIACSGELVMIVHDRGASSWACTSKVSGEGIDAGRVGEVSPLSKGR